MNKSFDYIDSDQKLTQFSQQISEATWIAVDTEFMRERTYYAQLALIQVASEFGNACIDPVAITDLSALDAVMQSADCMKIMHSASQDLEVLKHELGYVPSPLFDTQIAAGFLGAADQISYAAMTMEVLGIELSKEQTRTNWLQRPLTKEQIKYAQLDVLYLDQIRCYLMAKLEDAGRTSWHQQECQALVGRYETEDAIEQAWSRIKSAQSMDAQSQAIVRKLSAWRETVAQQRDLPREWVMGKQVIVDLARLAPQDQASLRQVESLTEKQGKRYGAQILTLIASARSAPVSVSITEPLSSEQRRWVKTLMEALRNKAEKMQVSPALIANRAMIEDVVRGNKDVAVLHGWRAEQIGNELLNLLDS